MSAFIRDQLAAARINLMKRRRAEAWKKAQAAKPCPDCGLVHPPGFRGLGEILRAAIADEEPTPPPPGEPRH